MIAVIEAKDSANLSAFMQATIAMQSGMLDGMLESLGRNFFDEPAPAPREKRKS